MHQGAQIQQ